MARGTLQCRSLQNINRTVRKVLERRNIQFCTARRHSITFHCANPAVRSDQDLAHLNQKPEGLVTRFAWHIFIGMAIRRLTRKGASMPDDTEYLNAIRTLWLEQKNPVWPWLTVKTSIQNKHPVPQWVSEYLEKLPSNFFPRKSTSVILRANCQPFWAFKPRYWHIADISILAANVRFWG